MITPTPPWQTRSRQILKGPLTDHTIIELGQHLLDAVATLVAHARTLYYAVMLSGYACPQCGGLLTMVREGRCRCRGCTHEFDPTIAFQTCSTCSGQLRLRIRRYECRQCGTPVRSHFLFDGLVFDAAYFRQKMAESRARKQERRERVRKMLADSRSPAAELPPAELEGLAALQTALDELTRAVASRQPAASPPEFDLHRYERHLQAHCSHGPVTLAEIPPLIEDARRDLVYRFIALIFLAHAGSIRIWQEGRDILVIHRETHTEG